jgi:hypothetical protein
MSFDPGGDTPRRMADYADLMRGENPARVAFLTTRSLNRCGPSWTHGQAVDQANPADPTARSITRYAYS